MFNLGVYELPEFEKWMCISPKGDPVHTGCGIIVDVIDLPDYFPPESSKMDKLFVIMTDFGNTFKFTIEELEDNYVAVRKELEPKARFERQQELLNEAFEMYIK